MDCDGNIGLQRTVCARIYVIHTLSKYKLKKARLKLCTDSGGSKTVKRQNISYAPADLRGSIDRR